MPSPSSAARAMPAAPLAPRKLRPAFVAQSVLVGSAIAVYLFVLGSAGLHHQDLDPYLAAGRHVLNGEPLYTTFLQHPFPDATLRPAFIYPPAFALLIAPLALLPNAVANLVWLIVGQLSLAAAMLLVLRWLRPPGWAVATVVAATLTFYPLWIDIQQGQANLLLLLLVTAGIAGIVQGRPRFGVALGVAAALKLTPLILLVWLLLERRGREAAWMVAGFAAVSGMAAIFRFQDTMAFAQQVLPALAPGTAFYANQSLAGVLERIASVNPYTQPWVDLRWAPLVAATAGIALVVVWFWRGSRQPALVRAASFLPLLPLLSSVTWGHHLVILLPVIWFSVIALAEAGWPLAPAATLGGLLLVFSVVSRWPAGPAFNQPGFRLAQTTDPPVFIVANALFFSTFILFLAAPWLLRSR